MRTRLFLAVLFLSSFTAGPAHATPKVGDKAPAIKIAKWMASPAPTLPGGKDAEKHVFLVEFWATWCGPCLRSIPHLADLHKKHAKEGLIVIGVSNEETDVVTEFYTKKLPARKLEMPYFVGCDDENTTSGGWMDEIDGIPHAFLVDKTGIVVWAGNPLADTEEMDDAIRQTLAGKYNLETAKKAAATRQRFNELINELQVAYQMQDKDTVFKLLDNMIEVKPKDVQPYLIRREMLRQFDMEDQIPAWDAKMESAMQDSAPGLMDLIDIELQKPLAERSAALLHRSASRAVQLTQSRDVEALSTLATVQCQLGMIDAAIATQKQAVELADPAEKETLKKLLTYLEEAKALSSKTGS